MKFIVVDIDHTNIDDLHVVGDNYLSGQVMATWQQYMLEPSSKFDYSSLKLDDLIGLSECCNDILARNEAINQILYESFGLRAINLIARCSVLKEHGRINQDLALINKKLCELGIGYISEKTYLVDSLAQYRLLVRDYMDLILTIRISRQTWNFINKYLSDCISFGFALSEQTLSPMIGSDDDDKIEQGCDEDHDVNDDDDEEEDCQESEQDDCEENEDDEDDDE